MDNIRLQLAIRAWEEGMGGICYRKIALKFNVCRATNMQTRVTGRRSLEKVHEDQQLLNTERRKKKE